MLKLDENLLIFLNHLVSQNPYLKKVIEYSASSFIYLVPIFLFFYWFWSNSEKKKIALFITLSGLASWLLINQPLCQFIARERPFLNQTLPLKELIFHRPTCSFPSDHLALLSALFFSSFFLKEKKLGYLFLILALFIGFSRISTGLHYPSDILAGFFVGLFSAFLFLLLKTLIFKYLVNPLYFLAKFLRLG